MSIARVDTPGQSVLRLVIAVVWDTELDSVKREFKRLHQSKDHVFVVMFFDSCEVEIGRKAPLASEEHLAKAGAALEGEFVQDPALSHQLGQVGEHDLVFSDRNVAQPGFSRVALNMWKRQDGSALPDDGMSSGDTGTVAQFVAGDIDSELPTVLVADYTRFRDSRTEKCSTASLRKILEMHMYVLGDCGASVICQPSEASRKCLGGHPAPDRWLPCASRCNGKPVARIVATSPSPPLRPGRSKQSRTVFSRSDIITVVAQHVYRTESEELSCDWIDDVELQYRAQCRLRTRAGVTSRMAWRCCVVKL